MSSSGFAASFAPYTPPPDDKSLLPQRSSVSQAPIRPWFPTHASSQQAATSYQSGGLPTLNTSLGGGAGVAEDAEGHRNQWETRFGMRVDVLAAFAYLLGPISALALLIVETHNDYVRFHAYQSALTTTPLILLRILASIAHFPSWMCIFLTITIVVTELYMAFRAYNDAARNGLARFQLPYVGILAEQWVGEE